MFPNRPHPQTTTPSASRRHRRSGQRLGDLCPWRQSWAEDIQEHDERLATAWNQVIGPEDWVVHLGDFALGTAAALAEQRRRLLGRICIVLGSHDRSVTAMRTAGFDVVVCIGLISDASGAVLCIHDPAEAPDPVPVGVTRVLHGHCHGKDPRAGLPSLHPLIRDCGIDVVGALTPLAWAAALG
jgi:calcineurin-like phosphoesterase family protein